MIILQTCIRLNIIAYHWEMLSCDLAWKMSTFSFFFFFRTLSEPLRERYLSTFSGYSSRKHRFVGKLRAKLEPYGHKPLGHIPSFPFLFLLQCLEFALGPPAC